MTVKQGSTPTFIFTLPFELSTIDDLRCTFWQEYQGIIFKHQKTYSDFIKDSANKKISVTFSQMETLNLKPNILTLVQLKVLFTDGSVGVSEIKSAMVDVDLDGGVIS